MFYLDEALDPATQQVVIQQSSRPSNDATDWPLYNKAKEDYNSSLQQCQQHRQALWSFLLTHVDADVDHLIKLHVDYPQASLDIETNQLWIILQQSVTQMDLLMYQKLKLNGQTINNLIMIYREMSHQLFPCPNISFDFKTSSTPSKLQRPSKPPN